MTTNRWHSHHTSCAVIGSYKPCRHSIVEVDFTIIAAEEPVLARQFDDNVDMRHLIEKYTPRMSCISQSEERDGKFEFTVRPSHLQCQLYEYNRPKREERYDDGAFADIDTPADYEQVVRRSGFAAASRRENESRGDGPL